MRETIAALLLTHSECPKHVRSGIEHVQWRTASSATTFFSDARSLKRFVYTDEDGGSLGLAIMTGLGSLPQLRAGH